MTVRELKELLENYDDNEEIVVSDGGTYLYDISKIKKGYGVRAFWGNDYKALVLVARDQVGAMWEEDELELKPRRVKSYD